MHLSGMKTCGRGAVVALLTALSALATAASAEANPRLVVDINSLKVYEQQDIFQRWYPASLTKLMTAYTTFRAIKSGQLTLDSPVVMTKNAAAEPPSKMFFKPGSKMTLDSALKMMLIKSANDIAVAIGETVAGSEPAFVAQMNAEAARIGMSNSHFVNPNGLPAPANIRRRATLRFSPSPSSASFRNMRPTSPMKASRRARKATRTTTC